MMQLLRLLLTSFFLIPASLLADQTDERLDGLFSTLLVSTDLTNLRATENKIWEIWFEHPNDNVEQLMQLGVTRMNDNR